MPRGRTYRPPRRVADPAQETVNKDIYDILNQREKDVVPSSGGGGGGGGGSAILDVGYAVVPNDEWTVTVTPNVGANKVWRCPILLEIIQGGRASRAQVYWKSDTQFQVMLDAKPGDYPYSWQAPERATAPDEDWTQDLDTLDYTAALHDGIVQYTVLAPLPVNRVSTDVPYLRYPKTQMLLDNRELYSDLWAIDPQTIHMGRSMMARLSPFDCLHWTYYLSYNNDFGQHADGATAVSGAQANAFGYVTGGAGPGALRLSGEVGELSGTQGMQDIGSSTSRYHRVEFSLYATFLPSDYLIWTHVPGATAYDLEYSINSDDIGTASSTTVEVVGTYADLSSSLDGDYSLYWRVRAKRGSTTGSWSETRASYTNNHAGPTLPGSLTPGTPTGLGFSQASGSLGKQITLSWTKSGGACRSELQLAVQSGASPGAVFYRIPLESSDTSFIYYPQVADIYTQVPTGWKYLANGTYYWRIREANEYSRSAWSAWTSFTIS